MQVFEITTQKRLKMVRPVGFEPTSNGKNPNKINARIPFRTWLERQTCGLIILFVLACQLIFAYPVHAGWDFSVTGSVSYDRATFSSGFDVAPGGIDSDVAFPKTIAGQIKYNSWRWQPTIEVSIKDSKFDFSDNYGTQTLWPRETSLRVGLTRDFEFVSIYGLIGYTHYAPHAKLAETLSDGRIHWHSTTPNEDITGIDKSMFSLKFGAYKVFQIGPVSVGPEFSLEVYPLDSPGVDRCRKVESNRFVPSFGIRVQY